MNTAFHIRPYKDADFAAVAAVYRDAVETLAGAAYTPEQIAIWADYADDVGDFRQRLARGGVSVAEMENEIVAFGQLEPADHVAFLYCKGRCARRGLASALYARMESEARDAGAVELRTEASRISRPFFEKYGFAVVEVEQAVRAGVSFERFKMTKPLH